MSVLRAALAGCWLLVISPLATSQTTATWNTASNSPPATAASTVTPTVPTGYLLGSGDQIHVTVFGEADVSGDYLVDAEGNITVPLIGAVPAAGQSTELVAQNIAGRLSSGSFVQNARVTARIIAYRPFFILGEVQKPGAYPFAPDLTVLSAVATAGGYTYRANTHRIYVRRAGQTTEQQASPDSVELHPGDTLRVGERFF